jgi:glycosyltransferase involved in cell wall biosynthesis
VKNHQLLLRAVRRLTAAGAPIHIVIVGDGPERAGLEQRTREWALGGSVTFTGTLPNRPNPHALFDVSALTSRSEGFPNAVVEAMAAGRPVVATDVGGVRDAVTGGVTGLLVPDEDDAGFAAALERLRGDPALAAALGQAGRREAEDRFSEEVVLNQLMALYEELAR